MQNRDILFITICLLFMSGILSAQDSKKNLIFSHPHGFYSEPFNLQISSELEGAKIKYTFDGSNPFTSSSAIVSNTSAIINVNPSNINNRDKAPGFIVTACAVLNDTLASGISTQTYLFINKITELSPNDQVPGNGWLEPWTQEQVIAYGLNPQVYNNSEYSPYINEAFTSIPTLSLVTDLKNLFDADSGIYVNAFGHGDEWERQVSLELLNPDSSKGFQINCGLRIRGGWSRHGYFPKHAFRVFFKKEYGKGKLKYPLFGNEGADEFDKFDIQTSMNYAWANNGDGDGQHNTFLRELFSRDTQRDMGQPYTRGRFYHLYINGTYWGIYQIQERAEAAYGATYFGGEKEDYDVIKVNVGVNFELYDVEATDGTLDKWRELWQAGQDGFSSDERYFRVQGLNPDGTPNPAYEKLLDVDNLIDYMINTFFVGDFDAPVSAWGSNLNPNNFYVIYNRINPDGFKFFRHDAEHSLFPNYITNWGYDRTGPYTPGQNFNDSNPQWIHQKLSENSNYRLRFADRVYKHFFNDGALTEQKNLERLNIRKQQLETAIIAESARWGDYNRSTPRTKSDWNNAVNVITRDFFPGRNAIVLQQLKNKQLFSDIIPPAFNKNGGIVEKGFKVELSGNGKIYYTIDGTDPYLPFSGSANSFNKIVVDASSAKKVLVPTADIGNAWKSDLSFDDSGWFNCTGTPGGVGYDTAPDYASFISLSLQPYMYQGAANPNNSCYIRIPFEVTSDELNKIDYMQLQMMIDDGFAAYINGVLVAESNVPAGLAWNSTANSAVEAGNYVSFDLSANINLLHSGTNLLAFQGLNVSTESSDFLLLPKLVIGEFSNSGSVAPTAIEYTGPISIEKTTKIKTRSLSGTDWSPLNEAMFIVNGELSNLRITELHYHPLGQDTIDDKEYEFIELKNSGNKEFNLNGASFAAGVDYIFGDTTLAPGEFFVLASNANEFYNRYSFMPDGDYEGQLDNGGERLVLVDAAGDTVFSFKYDDTSPWPEEADGDGYSLVSRSLTGEGNPDTPDYWLKSAVVNGSPGSDDLVSDISSDTKNIVKEFKLMQNYPNPFNPVTVIGYAIGTGQVPVGTRRGVFVQLKIYDLLGREVATLVNEEKPAGVYKLEFDGSSFSSGIYFYKISAGDFVQTRKMLLLK